MKLNLDALKDQILEYLEKEGVLVFRGFCRNPEARPIAYWDSHRAPEFQAFLKVAREAGAKLVVFNDMDFSTGMADDAMDRLEEYDMPVEARRGFERRLREMRAYQGFTCALELSFDGPTRTFIYELRADWYLDFLHLLDEIDLYGPEDEPGEEDKPPGGFFSPN